MNTLPAVSISPLSVASKLAGAANLIDVEMAEQLRKEPRTADMLWFIQAVSMQPGSVEKWASGMVDEYSTQFGPDFLHDEKDALTLEQRKDLWAKIDRDQQTRLISKREWKDFDGNAESNISNWSAAPRTIPEQRAFQAALLKIKPQTFRDVFIDTAKDQLPGYLRALCDENKKWPDFRPWWCKRLFSVLLQAMDAHASRQELQLVRTELVSVLFEKLDFARSKKRFIKIDGDSRSGKTEAVKTYAAMYPGRVRVVATPPGISLRDLLAALAESFGIPFTPETPFQKLKDQVQYVIRHCGLFLIFDEAHWLLPPPASTVSTPVRMDWLRSNIIDRRLPVAFVTTPQAFNQAVEKFKKRTGYNFDQLFGRIHLTVILPNETGNHDLLEVVRLHAAEFPEPAQRYIVNQMARAETYLSKIEAICCLAKYIAQVAGRSAVTMADVESAVAEVLSVKPATPARPQPIAVKSGRNTTYTTAPLLDGPARQTIPAPALEGPARSAAPALETATT